MLWQVLRGSWATGPDGMGCRTSGSDVTASESMCPMAWHDFGVKRRKKHLGIRSQAMLLAVVATTHL